MKPRLQDVTRVAGWGRSRVLLLSAGLCAPAQETRGSITGRVTDSSRAVTAALWMRPSSARIRASTCRRTSAPCRRAARTCAAKSISVLDLSALKNFALTESLKLQFRAEAINALNRANFSGPNLDPRSADFGRVTNTDMVALPLEFELGLKVVL